MKRPKSDDSKMLRIPKVITSHGTEWHSRDDRIDSTKEPKQSLV